MPAPRPTVLISCSFLLAALATSDVGAQPANDSCTTPQVVSLPFFFNGTTLGGQASATVIPGCAPFVDLWYAVVVPEAGDLAIDPSGGVFSAYVVPGGSAGVCPSESDRVLCSSGGATVPVTPGDLVLVQRQVGPSLAGVFSIDLVPDSCATATEIAALPFTEAVDLSAYGAEPGFPSCPADHDAWYVFHPTTSGNVAIGLRVPSNQARFAVFESTVFDPDSCPPESELIVCDNEVMVFPVVAGRHYWLRLSTTFFGVTEPLTGLEVDWLDPLPNDECVDAIPFTIGETASPELLVATNSQVVPCSVENDAWYTLTPPLGQPLRLLGVPNSRVSVFEGGAGCPGNLIACGEGIVTFLPVAGQTYLVRYGMLEPRVLPLLRASYPLNTDADDRYEIVIPATDVQVGETFQVPIRLSSGPGALGVASPMSGFSLSLCVDPASVELLDLDLGSDTSSIGGGGGPDFWNHTINDFGLTTGLIVSLLGSSSLPSDQDLEVLRVTGLPLVGVGATFVLEFCNAVPQLLGTEVVVVDLSGTSIVPVIEDGMLTVIEAGTFRRGDANLDAVIDLADALAILDVLFDTAPGAFPCALAADVNDDEQVDIADPIALLDHLFAPVSPPIPPPVCGEDPTAGSLGCAQPTSCP